MSAAIPLTRSKHKGIIPFSRDQSCGSISDKRFLHCPGPMPTVIRFRLAVQSENRVGGRSLGLARFWLSEGTNLEPARRQAPGPVSLSRTGKQFLLYGQSLCSLTRKLQSHIFPGPVAESWPLQPSPCHQIDREREANTIPIPGKQASRQFLVPCSAG